MNKLSLHTWIMVACLSAPLFAQEHQPIGRTNPTVVGLDGIAVRVVPALDRPAIAAQDAINDRAGAPARYAIPRPVDITPANAGTWEVADPQHVLWRLRVHSPGASHVNLGFRMFKLTTSAQLMVYSRDYSYIVRPFTGRDHNPDGQFWTPIVRGEEIVVELYVPTAERAKVQLHLTQIGSGYRFFGAGTSALTGDGSGSCNVNVICPQGNGWRNEITAIAAYSTGGSIFCTGAMVNNTANNNRNFFLTADHCGINAGNASSLVAYFNYDEPTCAASGSAPLNMFVTGATFRADYSTSDVTLVELNSTPNAAWGIHYAGWDRTGANASSATGIHHPSGDAKKISMENQATTTTSYSSNTVPGNGSHIRVIDWDSGTTEPGSSGSPLFDQNKRVIGQLHGGGAACGNNLSDWYGKFSVSWAGGGTNATRLSNWLDPSGSGATTTNTIALGGGGGPANDDCANAIVVSNGVNGPYSSVNANNSSPAWPCAGTGGSDVWFRYTATCTGPVTLSTCSATRTYDTGLQAFSGSCASLTSEGCNDDGGGTCGFGSMLNFNATIGTTYLIRVGGYNGASGVFDLTITCTAVVPPNDNCSGAISVFDGVNGPYDTSAATTTSSPSWTCGFAVGADIWFRYTATCTGFATFTTCGAARTFDTVLAAYSGTCGSPSLEGCNDDGGGCGLGSTLSIPVISGTNYLVRLGGYSGALGQCEVTVTCTSNDECADAFPLADGPNGPFDNNTATTSAQPWPASGCGFNVGDDVWFSYTASAAGCYVFDTCSAARTVDTVMQALSGSCGSLTSEACNDDLQPSSCGTASRVSVTLSGGQTIYIRVGGFNGANGAFEVNVTPPSGSGTVTTFSTGCGGLTLNVGGSPNIGETLTFSVSGTGGGPAVIVFGFAQANTPLCAGAPCALGLVVSGTISTSPSLPIRCDPRIIGNTTYFQALALPPTSSCLLLGSIPLFASDTVRTIAGH